MVIKNNWNSAVDLTFRPQQLLYDKKRSYKNQNNS